MPATGGFASGPPLNDAVVKSAALDICNAQKSSAAKGKRIVLARCMGAHSWLSES
jgi:hypothetical protein